MSISSWVYTFTVLEEMSGLQIAMSSLQEITCRIDETELITRRVGVCVDIWWVINEI